MDLGDKREAEAVFHSDSLRGPSDWPGVIVEMPIPVPLGRFSLVGGFSGLLLMKFLKTANRISVQ